jgi:all-trans-retinol 13,14-reductase
MSKITIELVHKTNLLTDITCLIFQTQDSFKFKPGQFLAIEVAPKVHRSYSLFYCDNLQPNYYKTDLVDLQNGKYIGLMINTKPDGVGSNWAKNITLQQKFPAIGCNGQFVIQESKNSKVFVATSTGIAPFVPMIESLIKQNLEQQITVFFSSLSQNEDFSDHFFDALKTKNPNLKVYKCYDSLELGKEDESHKLGRVTQIIPAIMTIEQMQNSDFYLCGNPMMVEATAKLLVENGVENVYYEKY